jgi:hypothetical protein
MRGSLPDLGTQFGLSLKVFEDSDHRRYVRVARHTTLTSRLVMLSLRWDTWGTGLSYMDMTTSSPGKDVGPFPP